MGIQRRGGTPPDRRPGGRGVAKKGSATPRTFRPLPPIKPPAISPDRRAVLVACSATGRASWAEFATAVGGGWNWLGNVQAVPDLEAARGGGSGTGSGSSASPALPAGGLNWSGYRCGVCDCGSAAVPGQEGHAFYRCSCGTIFCAGGFGQVSPVLWSIRCPGCGEYHSLAAGQDVGKITEYETTTAAPPNAAGLLAGRPGAGITRGPKGQGRGQGSGGPSRRQLPGK